MHTETIKHVKSVEIVDGEEGFSWVHLSVITTGNVRKTVRVPHYSACFMGSQILSGYELMDKEPRVKSWQASIEWIKEKMRRR
jgi:hypothetical protein